MKDSKDQAELFISSFVLNRAYAMNTLKNEELISAILTRKNLTKQDSIEIREPF